MPQFGRREPYNWRRGPEVDLLKDVWKAPQETLPGMVEALRQAVQDLQRRDA